MSDRYPSLISFSGIDGAGKTTQIESVCAQLDRLGYRVTRVTFWDDVAVFSRFRANVSVRVLGRKKSLQNEKPLRNDKNVRLWYLTLVRTCFYLLDSLRLRVIVHRLKNQASDFIVFDRYIYDQAVQVRARHWIGRMYIRLLLALAPTPQFAFVLDASPDHAFRRKPEYPLDFMHEYRRAFLGLRDFVPDLRVISPGTVEEVQARIMNQVLKRSENAMGTANSFTRPARFTLNGFQ